MVTYTDLIQIGIFIVSLRRGDNGYIYGFDPDRYLHCVPH